MEVNRTMICDRVRSEAIRRAIDALAHRRELREARLKDHPKTLKPRRSRFYPVHLIHSNLAQEDEQQLRAAFTKP
jgi:Arc/MetJ-type ribon-helix-helix transcriptional regulator